MRVGGELRRLLAETPHDVAMVELVNLNGRELPRRQRVRRFFRAGTTLETAHNGYLFDGRFLLGDRARVSVAPALDLSHLLTIAHDNGNRGKERDEAARQYRRARGKEWAR